MPLYEYECVECNEKFESFTSMIERDNLKPCDKCGHKAKRLISAPRAIFIDGAGSITNRGDDYWDRATKRQSSDISKKQSIQTEKLQFGDKKAVALEKRKIVNYERTGNQASADKVIKTLKKK